MTEPTQPPKKTKKHGARYPPELRAKALVDLKAGLGPSEVAKKHGVNTAIVSYWRSVATGKAHRVSKPRKGASRGGGNRLLLAMAKSVKDQLKQHVRDGGDIGDFETDVAALANAVMRMRDEEEE